MVGRVSSADTATANPHGSGAIDRPPVLAASVSAPNAAQATHFRSLARLPPSTPQHRPCVAPTDSPAMAPLPSSPGIPRFSLGTSVPSVAANSSSSSSPLQGPAGCAAVRHRSSGSASGSAVLGRAGAPVPSSRLATPARQAPAADGAATRASKCVPTAVDPSPALSQRSSSRAGGGSDGGSGNSGSAEHHHQGCVGDDDDDDDDDDDVDVDGNDDVDDDDDDDDDDDVDGGARGWVSDSAGCVRATLSTSSSSQGQAEPPRCASRASNASRVSSSSSAMGRARAAAPNAAGSRPARRASSDGLPPCPRPQQQAVSPTRIPPGPGQDAPLPCGPGGGAGVPALSPCWSVSGTHSPSVGASPSITSNAAFAAMRQDVLASGAAKLRSACLPPPAFGAHPHWGSVGSASHQHQQPMGARDAIRAAESADSDEPEPRPMAVS